MHTALCMARGPMGGLGVRRAFGVGSLTGFASVLVVSGLAHRVTEGKTSHLEERNIGQQNLEGHAYRLLARGSSNAIWTRFTTKQPPRA